MAAIAVGDGDDDDGCGGLTLTTVATAVGRITSSAACCWWLNGVGVWRAMPKRGMFAACEVSPSAASWAVDWNPDICALLRLLNNPSTTYRGKYQ